MVVYDDIENLNKYKKLFKKYKNVTVYKTKYSIKIDYGKKKVFLNKGGENRGANILGLINRVKRDAQNFLDKAVVNTTSDNSIFWSYYNDESNLLNQGTEFQVAKMDLTSAYWTRGINDKIISKETVDYFENMVFENFDSKEENNKDKKQARLKAFGSLATTKHIEVYNYGVRSKEIIPPIMNKQFRDIYMGICNGVAEDMQTVLSHVNGIFYYWDCIFIDPKYIEIVEELFKDLGYNCTIEKHTASVVRSKHISYFCCPDKNGKIIQYQIEQ